MEVAGTIRCRQQHGHAGVAAGILRHDHWATKSLCEERPQDADSHEQHRQAAGLWRLFIVRRGRQGGPDVRASGNVSLFFAWVHVTSIEPPGRLSAWAIDLLERSFQTSFPTLPREFLTSLFPLLV